jgi:hypothetical protein
MNGNKQIITDKYMDLFEDKGSKNTYLNPNKSHTFPTKTIEEIIKAEKSMERDKAVGWNFIHYRSLLDLLKSDDKMQIAEGLKQLFNNKHVNKCKTEHMYCADFYC